MRRVEGGEWGGGLGERYKGEGGRKVERGGKIRWRDLFRYLMKREEREYQQDGEIEVQGKS